MTETLFDGRDYKRDGEVTEDEVREVLFERKLLSRDGDADAELVLFHVAHEMREGRRCIDEVTVVIRHAADELQPETVTVALVDVAGGFLHDMTFWPIQLAALRAGLEKLG